MNDNIIKMFIGGEEVVSNKEFTINEEMLSASSTILNNCYPASWEESKDYVSNFYYPKDYSKYILGKGNFTYGTDQYSILSVSGETFMQFTTNVEKEWNSFDVYGKSTQATRSGKNLLENTGVSNTSNGITFTVNDDKTILVNGNNDGTANSSFIINNYSLKAGTYILNGCPSGGSSTTYRIVIQKTSGWSVLALDTGSGSKQFTIDEATKIQVAIFIQKGQTISNLLFKPMIRLSSIIDDTYEPYGVMPSPDYPSEIESVGYENLFNKLMSNYTSFSNTITIDSVSDNSITLTISSTGGPYDTVRYYSVANLVVGKTYTVSANIVGNDNSLIRLVKNNSGEGSAILGYVRNNNSFTFTYDGSYNSLGLFLYVSHGVKPTEDLTATFSNIQIEESSQSHSYIPYGKYGIEVKNTGKNLLNIFENYTSGQSITSNGITYKINENGTITANGTATANSGLDIYSTKSRKSIKKGTYTLSGSIGGISSTYRIIIGTDKEYFSINGGTTFTINEDTSYYMTIRIYKGTTVDNIVFKPMIEKGTQATEYEQYKSTSLLFVLDQPLRSLPNGVKDIAYIKNNILYVDRKVGSIVLDGSDDENWTLNGSNQGYGIVINDVGGNSNSYIISGGYCNCLSETIQNNIYSGRKDNVFATLGGTFHKIYVRYNSSITSIALLKEQLNSQPIIVQYELAEPYTEEVGKVDMPYSYEGINNTTFDTSIDTEETIYYYWKNYDVLFAGIVKNSGDISLRPTDPKYCSLQILDYKTFLSESDTLDFVISDKTISEAISMVVDAISGYGFILGTINISQADDVIGAYSTLNKTAYDVFQYLANISGSRWRARFVDNDTMAIDFYDPELLPRANDIDYTQQYWEDNKIVDLTFNYGTRDYRNKQIILSDEVYGGIDYTEVLLSNGYGTSYITQNNIANITSITVNGVKAEVITQSEKDLGVDADFYYTPGKNVVESTTSYTAGTQIIITYTPLVKGRQIVYNDEEVTRIATQTNTTGVISRYENRNDILSSDELENIAETYIKYKGKPEIILKLTTLNNDLFNIGEICYFNSPITDLAQDYMVKSKATNYTSVAGETNIFYTYELTSSFNSEKAINYFDNQRNKTTGNIAEGESITRNIDINNSAMIIWENATITEISVSVDGDNALNSVLNSPFIQ